MLSSLLMLCKVAVAITTAANSKIKESFRISAVTPSDLKTALRQLLLEDPSFIKSVLMDSMPDGREKDTACAPDQTEEVSKLKEDVKRLTVTVKWLTLTIKKQQQLDELEKSVQGTADDRTELSSVDLPASKSLNDLIGNKNQHDKANGTVTNGSSLVLHTANRGHGHLGPDHVTEHLNNGRFPPKRLVMSEGPNIAFTAYVDHDLEWLNPGQVIQFNKALLNAGNGYNTFTGIFTVPVSGVYLFTFFFSVPRYKAEMQMVVDSVHKVSSVAGTSGDSGHHDTMGGNTAIISVHQGQSVWIETMPGASNTLSSFERLRKTTFSGALLFT